jgi:hypothetical protein
MKRFIILNRGEKMKIAFWKKEKIDFRRPVERHIEEEKVRLMNFNGHEQKEIVSALLKFAFPSHHVHANPTQKELRCRD